MLHFYAPEKRIEIHEQLWEARHSDGPIIAVANHNGHALRREVQSLVALDDQTRLREEDPYTGEWAKVAPSYMIMLRSRFEVDLNRPRDEAVYLTPEDDWGLELWKTSPPDVVIEASLAQYDAYYSALAQMCAEKLEQNGAFVVLDLHSYNCRRNGPSEPEDNPEGNPQVNIGTGTMDRNYWGSLIDRFITDLRNFAFPGGCLDVRDNVKFVGRQLPNWVHTKFPRTGCAIAVEFKKFFMDEWTGELDLGVHTAIKQALAATLPGLEDELRKRGAHV